MAKSGLAKVLAMVAAVGEFVKVASKAETIEVGKAVEYVFNRTPYMELGEGYAEHVAQNAHDDSGMDWRYRLRGDLVTRVEWLERELKEAKEKRAEAARKHADVLSALQDQEGVLAEYRRMEQGLRSENARLQEDLREAFAELHRIKPVVGALGTLRDFFAEKAPGARTLADANEDELVDRLAALRGR